MTGQSGRIPFLCEFSGVRVEARPDVRCPVKACALARERASVDQQECLCCQSKGQLIIWSAAFPVVVTAADCHEERCRNRGGKKWWRGIAR